MPLRVVAVIGVVGDFAFAMVSKTKYQKKPVTQASKARFWLTYLILLLIVAAVATGLLLQPVS